MAVNPTAISHTFGHEYSHFHPANPSVSGSDYLPALGPAGGQAYGRLDDGWPPSGFKQEASSGFGGGQAENSDDASVDGDELAPLPSGSGGRGKGKKAEKEVKRRSSKACDNCRKCKCKCNRAPLPDGTIPSSGPCQNCVATGVECTFNGASRKRGPPKGYIEAIESRLHRMEALLGGLLENDDPRAQALLSELIGDNEAKELLKKDLKLATEQTENGKTRKSWKLPPLPVPEPKISPAASNTSASGEAGSFRLEVPDDEKVQGSTAFSRHRGGDENANDSDDGAEPAGTAGEDESQRRNQRRRLNSDAISRSGKSNGLIGRDSLAPGARPSNTIPHTGTATFTLGESGLPLSPTVGAPAGSAEPLSELADVVGQLSLDENSQVRYHGRSSGLYLISKSDRYRDFFWRFPKPGVWPPAQTRVPKSEAEIARLTNAASALPDRETMDHLLQLYWAFVHPVIPVLYKEDFLRGWRTILLQRNIACAFTTDGRDGSPLGGGKVSLLLLLVMFSLAARYSDRESKPNHGEYWPAGDHYLAMAKSVLNHDYASSKLTTCQALVLLAYREVGIGAMAESWLYTGMAIRMAQDMGLFRDVEKWFMPVPKFSHDEKQTRKRVWWACVILDVYVSTYIGRPMMIFERDYDTAFPSLDEPDEHEQWRALRLDGSDFAREPPAPSTPSPGVSPSSNAPSPIDPDSLRPAYPSQRTYAISCFNHAASLAAHIQRIVANIYAIRVRVMGQSSESLLSLLDQNLANWYLQLPEPLQYNLSSKRVPPPHILTLHAQFYTALILLHRPFIPAQHEATQPTSFPSHSICTTAANSIATIATTYSKTFGLRQSSPFLVYYIFTAAILHVYNSTFDPGLAVTAKRNLFRCMNALKEMESTWGGAIRAWELLSGLVDFRDVDLSITDAASPSGGEDRGVKRPVEEATHAASSGQDAFRRLTSFHTRGPSVSSQSRRSPTVPPSHASDRSASSHRHSRPPGQASDVRPRQAPNSTRAGATNSLGLAGNVPNPTFGANSSTGVVVTPPGQHQQLAELPQVNSAGRAKPTSSEIFGLAIAGRPAGPQAAPAQPPAESAAGPIPSGPSFGEMVNSFLGPQTFSQPPSQAAVGGHSAHQQGGVHSMNATASLGSGFTFDFSSVSGLGGMDIASGFDSSAFFSMPLSADAQADDWQSYLPAAFPSPSSGVHTSSPGNVNLNNGPPNMPSSGATH